ncbi:MAG: DUF4919 domain-containing protein [Bacteroidaceae bacterium]|nr:DUF4919 domain-containing protein [Bacteroidaceae bacterium]
MKRFLSLILLFITCATANSQVVLDNETIEDIVKNEREYFDQITEIYKNDDPMLRIDDIALIYYGQAFMPQYRPGKDENEKALKRLHDEKKNAEVYNVAKNILEYNPVSLNALFSIYIASRELGKSDEECISYLKKYQSILDMICYYGDGKSSESAFRIITPDDQDYIIYGKLQIEDVVSQQLDTETLCNIITVKPSDKFQGRCVYFDLSLFLSQAERE